MFTNIQFRKYYFACPVIRGWINWKS